MINSEEKKLIDSLNIRSEIWRRSLIYKSEGDLIQWIVTNKCLENSENFRNQLPNWDTL